MNIDSSGLRSSVAHDETGCTLTVAGEVDVFTSPQLKRLLDGVLGSDPPPPLIRADLTGVEFLDTVGLGLLLSARTRAEALGSRFVVSSTSPTLDRLFAVTGVATILRGAAE